MDEERPEPRFGELKAKRLVDLVSFNAMMAATPWAQSMALAEQLPAMALKPDLLSCAVLCEQLLGPALLSWQTRLQRKGLKLLERLAGMIAGGRRQVFSCCGRPPCSPTGWPGRVMPCSVHDAAPLESLLSHFAMQNGSRREPFEQRA